MGLALQALALVFAAALVVQRSAASNISPSPSIFKADPSTEVSPIILIHHIAPSPSSLQNDLHLPLVMPPSISAPAPRTAKEALPSLSRKTVPPSFTGHEIVPIPPPNTAHTEEPLYGSPVSVPVVRAPVATPGSSSPPQKSPSMDPLIPGSDPPSSYQNIVPMYKAPPAKPNSPEPIISSASTPLPSANPKIHGMPITSPPKGAPHPTTPENYFPLKAPPLVHNPSNHRNNVAPLSSRGSPPIIRAHAPASLPLTSSYTHHHGKENIKSPSPSPLQSLSPPTKQGSRQKRRHGTPPSPSFLSGSGVLPASSPSPTASPGQSTLPSLSPDTTPGPSPTNPKLPLLPTMHEFPPPPPNEDCSSLTCAEPLTNTVPGSPCGCVWPMQVGLRLGVALYTFFPSVSELAKEISVGVFMRQSQVRIMGANAASQDPEKTIVLVNLVPLGEQFDNTTAYLTSARFWKKQVVIQTSIFGNYEVLYVRYPGLPPSPPSSIDVMDGEPYSHHGNNRQTMKPLGVDVSRVHRKHWLSGSAIAIIVLSASVVIILSCAVALFVLSKRRHNQQGSNPSATLSFLSKPLGIPAYTSGSGQSSMSLSYGSSMAPYTGSAKVFSSSDIEKATDNFNDSRVLGEGGFGRVYSGVLTDGTKVAVKVLKRDDQQGSREFLAEVEMLTRLHHRNLVKLIGICTEDRARCLVYELIPNGSVESHLHGVDKDVSPLDWVARLKIALGAARALAYLHEDSSPRVIHRDFKSSNILLEDDFTPKISDFGLARTGLDEENKHISTRVMGTFGYVAPEYAMTGHLLVKSDVYSYGVVLLELLTGRKPVDMSQPPGQENLVTWARPLLTNQGDLESIIDPKLGPQIPFSSIAKVSAIASMCVQPEVSHRPFMGEVVQALKLVCNECDVAKEFGSRSYSRDDRPMSIDPLDTHLPVSNYDCGLDVEGGFSVPVSDVFRFKRLENQHSGSFRRHSSPGSLRTGRGDRVWEKLRSSSGGTMSKHRSTFRFWSSSH